MGPIFPSISPSKYPLEHKNSSQVDDRIHPYHSMTRVTCLPFTLQTRSKVCAIVYVVCSLINLALDSGTALTLFVSRKRGHMRNIRNNPEVRLFCKLSSAAHSSP